MHVDFSFCFVYILGTNFSITESIFNGTAAFTNPTDLASSGVWENVFPATAENPKYCLLQLFFFDLRDPMCQIGTENYIMSQSRVNSGQAQKVTEYDVIKRVR